jgi:hypothetical protein
VLFRSYPINKLYHHDSSRAAIHHTRLRLGLSGLSSHRCDYNHINDPACPSCAAKIEDPHHYFIACPTFAGPRDRLLRETSIILQKYDIDIDFRKRHFRESLVNTLLRGSPQISITDNKELFKYTQEFICESQRFQ